MNALLWNNQRLLPGRLTGQINHYTFDIDTRSGLVACEDALPNICNATRGNSLMEIVVYSTPT